MRRRWQRRRFSRAEPAYFAGTCAFLNPIVLPVVNGVSITGASPGTSTLLYTGLNTSTDIISVGNNKCTVRLPPLQGATVRFHRSISSGGDGESSSITPRQLLSPCSPGKQLGCDTMGPDTDSCACRARNGCLYGSVTTRKWLNRPAHAAAFVRCRSGEARWGTTRQKQLCCSAL